MSTIAVRISSIEKQGVGSIRLRVQALNGALPAFEAGAHIDLHLPNGLVRQYSLAGSPRELDQYLLCIKREPFSRGGSAYIHEQLKAGDQLMISAPRNAFPLLPADRHLLIAAGIGITPLLSMAEELQAEGRPYSLHYYSRTPHDQALRDHLHTRLPMGNICLYYSSQGQSPRQHVPPELLLRQPGSRLYMCGLQEFMNVIRERANQSGWPMDHIHSEAFAACPEPAQGDAFEVTLARSGKTVTVTSVQSIAMALQDAGVEVPLSCETGICGACLTGLLEGQGDHRDQVLSDSEKADNQQIALCCSRSRSLRLVLDL